MRIQTTDTSTALQDFKQLQMALKMEHQHNGVHYGACSLVYPSVCQLVDHRAKQIRR